MNADGGFAPILLNSARVFGYGRFIRRSNRGLAIWLVHKQECRSDARLGPLSDHCDGRRPELRELS